MTSAISAELAGRFQLHASTIDHFAGGWLRRFPQASSLSGLRALMPPSLFHQMLHNLSHIERGERLYKLAEKHRPGAEAGSVLDIGCGIGGCLVAFGKRGFKLHGIELSPERTEMCRKNLAHNGLRCSISTEDLCVEGMNGRTFDVLICNSVIEHVDDPEAMIRRFSELLNPNGVLVFGVANSEALGNVISDPHYGLFGLTLLGRGVADRLYDALVEHRQSYSVTEWYSIARYAALINRAVGPVELNPPLDETRSIEATPGLLARLTAKFDEAVRSKALSGDPSLRRELEFATAAYLQKLGEAYGAGLNGARRDFEATYINKSYQLVAVMPSLDGDAGERRKRLRHSQ